MNKINTYIIYLLLALLSTGEVKSQKVVKFKDVLEILNEGNDEKSFETLLEFQFAVPDNPVITYNLGELYIKKIQPLDAFDNYEEILYYSKNAREYFSTSKSNLVEKDVKKYDDYFPGTSEFISDKKLKVLDVITRVDSVLTDLDNKVEKINQSRNLLYSAMDQYNECQNLYGEVVQKNRNIKDLYLSQEEGLLNNIETLKLEFESVILKLEEFKVLNDPDTNINNPNINNPNYILKEIENYRIDGSEGSSFLSDQIVLWNYAFKL